MSRNLSDNTRQRQPLSAIGKARTQQTQVRTLQQQGSQSTRLAVVEGYLEIPLSDYVNENARFVEIEAPSGTVLIGSLVYSSYWVQYDPYSAYPTDIWNLDSSNATWGGVVWKVWLPQSRQSDDPDYQPAFYWNDPYANILPRNRIRIGAKVSLQQGLGSTDLLSVFVLYQLRMTIGWN